MSEIFQNIIKASLEMPAVAKKGRNTNQNYDYRKVQDIIDQCSEVIARNNIAIIPQTIESKETRFINEKGASVIDRLIRVKWILGSPSGETIEAITEGEGRDNYDKSLNKAFTSAYKNFLEKTFMISFEESDSEKEDIEGKASKKSKQEQPKPEIKSNPNDKGIDFYGYAIKDGQFVPKDFWNGIREKTNGHKDYWLKQLEDKGYGIYQKKFFKDSESYQWVKERLKTVKIPDLLDEISLLQDPKDVETYKQSLKLYCNVKLDNPNLKEETKNKFKEILEKL